MFGHLSSQRRHTSISVSNLEDNPNYEGLCDNEGVRTTRQLEYSQRLPKLLFNLFLSDSWMNLLVMVICCYLTE
jgi:hypothetical protein